MCCIVAPGIKAQQLQTSCASNLSHPIKVCFQEPGVVFDRCTKELKLDFYVELLNVGDRYKYQVVVSKTSASGQKAELLRFEAREWLNSSTLHVPPLDLPSFRLDGKNKSNLDGQYFADVTAWTESRDPSIPSDKDADGAVTPVDFQRKVHAIVIGVSNYTYGSHAAAVQDRLIFDLNYAAHDAEQFLAFLEEVFPREGEDFEKVLLLNSNATKNDLLIAFRQLTPENACEGDLVILYFSGHTFIHPGIRERFIGTSDYNPRRPSDGYSYMQLLQTLQSTKAEKLIVFDSCYSGLVEAARDPTDAGTPIEGGSAVAFTGKLQVVMDFGRIAQNSDIGDESDAAQAVNGELALLDFATERIALYSAAGSNVQALEVPISQSPLSDDGRHVLLPGEKTNKTLTGGHGLFTYYFLRGLEKQLSKDHKHSDFAEDGEATELWSTKPLCKFDFGAAYSDARTAIYNIGRHSGMTLQVPGEHTKKAIEGFQCKRKPSGD
jgi:hypothetical protein